MNYHIEIFNQEFNPFKQLEKHHKNSPCIGAQSIFIGYMRDFRKSNKVKKMSISTYPPMTKNHIEKLAKNHIESYHLHYIYIAHREGEVYPNSPLVLICSSATHRTNAIRATASLLEKLKHNVPFWKKEYYDLNNSSWVKNNTNNNIQTR